MITKTAKVKVYANILRWQWSGISVNEGDLISIKAMTDSEGLLMEWSIGFGHPCNAAGHDYTAIPAFRTIYFRDRVGDNYHCGALLVSIGMSEAELYDDDYDYINPQNPERMFEVGLNKTFKAKYTGKLCFLCNDKSQAGAIPGTYRPDTAGYGDNNSYVGAEVTVYLPD
jgi:hypothetical protein